MALRTDECHACGACEPFLACLIAADVKAALALSTADPWAMPATEAACACTTTGLSGIRSVDRLGCSASTAGAKPWCYVAGGVRCESARPSPTLLGAAMKECDAEAEAAGQCQPEQLVWLLSLAESYEQGSAGAFEAMIAQLGSACQRCARQAVTSGAAAMRSCIPALQGDASAVALRFIQASADGAVSFRIVAAGAAPKTVLRGSEGAFGAGAVVPYTRVPLLAVASGGVAVTIVALAGGSERGRSVGTRPSAALCTTVAHCCALGAWHGWWECCSAQRRD